MIFCEWYEVVPVLPGACESSFQETISWSRQLRFLIFYYIGTIIHHHFLIAFGIKCPLRSTPQLCEEVIYWIVPEWIEKKTFLLLERGHLVFARRLRVLIQ